ncbi:MAG: DUF2218 domain-containing protein [Actinobacteria bacterium]|nr:DUF2218 domain-containing protein [Actinomycetota bacterium]
MLIANARIETKRSSRYLVQLCRHVNERIHSHPGVDASIDWTHDRGVASLGPGRCTLRAEPGVLMLRAEAPDPESLRRVQERFGGLVERFGKRERLRVSWTSGRGAERSVD